ncbi:MAG: ATP-dependent RNA helicase HrpA, partial [Acidiferrobacterales bacterium]
MSDSRRKGASLAGTIKALENEISQCMLADRRQLRRLARVRRTLTREQPDSTLHAEAAELQKQIAESAARYQWRQTHRPIPTFSQSLPVVARRDDIAEAIAVNPVVVVCGETGSGKTTQLPQICLALGRGIDGMIGHTQPRRIAARTVATRIAEELGSEVGRAVGYQVRFQDRVSPNTYIKVMTDGILLAETQTDRWLERYDTLIIDEAHERGLNIDFLLGYVKQLLRRRRDLRLVITSATIDPRRLAEHFNNAPIVEVSGRTYPVEVRYRPLSAADEDEREHGLQQAILDAVDELCAIDKGDVLVFLSGEREIRETAEALRKHHPADSEVLPLYARLSAVEQNKVFQPHSKRRIVLATNVAETSLTVPGIRYVVDSGYARISRYSPRTKVQRLPIETISRASADQRKGRCGRLSAGVCMRLYSEEDYESRPQFTEPEILRTNLAGVILQMQALGLGEIEQFPFVDHPDTKLVKDGLRLLLELGALDADNKLTAIGRQLAKLPVDPRIGRLVLAARDEGCLNEVLTIASVLSVQDPRERPLEASDRADERHRQFVDERSDFVSLLNLWRLFEERS